jgi:hypothetical protein
MPSESPAPYFVERVVTLQAEHHADEQSGHHDDDERQHPAK